MGNGMLAESAIPTGVVKSLMQDSVDDAECIAVIRTQAMFSSGRVAQLNKFVCDIIAVGHPFHGRALANFEEGSAKFFDNQLEIVDREFGNAETPEQPFLSNLKSNTFW